MTDAFWAVLAIILSASVTGVIVWAVRTFGPYATQNTVAHLLFRDEILAARKEIEAAKASNLYVLDSNMVLSEKLILILRESQNRTPCTCQDKRIA